MSLFSEQSRSIRNLVFRYEQNKAFVRKFPQCTRTYMRRISEQRTKLCDVYKG